MLDQDCLQQIVQDVCDAMLQLELRLEEPSNQASPDYLATIRILGECAALVEVGASSAMARHIAATMFATSAADVSHDELLDSLGEVVNMIGGNIKGVLGGEADLSLPCVGAFDECTASEMQRGMLVSMVRDGAFLSVRLLQMVPATADA